MTPTGVLSVKSPEAFRTISEVAVMLEVPQHVLRFWETRFPQIKPIKRAGGRRFYRPEDVDLLRGIQLLLYFEGYTIRGAQKVLREKGVRYTAALGREEAKKQDARAPKEPRAPKGNGFDNHVAVPVIEQSDVAAVTTLAELREDVGEAVALEHEEPDVAVEIEPEPVDLPVATPALVVRAAAVMSGANPRQLKLEALRTELLELKSRLIAARGGR
jgi:DNA-binding transcriptional MerR regulator